MKIAVLRETVAGEHRVAATPETVAKLIGLGATISVEKGAGQGSRISDAQFAEAGASIAASTAEAVKGADIVLAVRRPAVKALTGVNPGALLVAALDPYGNEGEVAALANSGVTARSWTSSLPRPISPATKPSSKPPLISAAPFR
jgi:NAD(P) transhydrogenase subunit alpha